MSDPSAASVEAILEGLATHDPSVLESLLAAQLENLDASGLDPDTYFLVKIAALVAIDAAPASFVWQIGLALEAGVTPEQIVGVLVALAPTVGNARIVAAAPEIALGLGLIDEED
ncbi:MAG: carboxymuconolactone decarboxylase family protein [Acidimicrobiales bacterium]|nr:carboxymuconolactone decarboxylase family protein [Acidimicrobiales bacterium]